jgi:hypothetical protein
MRKLSTAFICFTVLAVITSCSHAPDDVQIVKSVRTEIQQDSSISGDIQVESEHGMVTLRGHVGGETERAAAARHAAAVTGVAGVYNLLTVESAAVAPSPRERRSAPSKRRQEATENQAPAKVSEPPEEATRVPAPAAAAPAVNTPARGPVASAAPAPQPSNPAPVSTPPAPVPVKHVVPSGTVLSIRLIDSLDSAKNKVGDTFRATLKVPLTVDGDTVIPAGADVEGRVADVSNAGRFTGKSELNLELMKLTYNGTVYPLQTQSYDKAGDSRGKGTAETVGGGAVLGAIIGAIAGGGKGAAIGSTAGAGAGGATRAAKSGKRITFPSETVLTFKLQQPITVITTKGSGDARTPAR